MGRPRQPVQVVVAKGKKNLTKKEIKERLDQEVQPIAENIIAPDYLNKTQTRHFNEIADQLKELGIMGETDIDALARYIISRDLYINAVKQLRKKEVLNNLEKFEAWTKVQDRYFKQCRQCANDLGLTISSRCRLVVPQKEKETPKENKFNRFEKRVNSD